MSRIDTLTAYQIDFKFLERNNPLINDLREAIHAGSKPEYSFNDFVHDYTDSAKNLAVGENTERGILLSEEYISVNDIENGVKRWHIRPRAGKQGKPVTLYKISTKKEYNYNSDSAALYEHHVFVYEDGETIIAIFHRQNGSGCKSVFLETANKVLKTKGSKLEMTLIAPPEQVVQNAIPSKITLQYFKDVESSDIADNYNRKKKRIPVRNLVLNLEAADNNPIKKILNDLQLGNKTPDDAFCLVKAECPNGQDYNDAEIQFRVGSQRKTVRWNEFESMFGSYDISEELASKTKRGKSFLNSLIESSDSYFKMIVESLKEREQTIQ